MLYQFVFDILIMEAETNGWQVSGIILIVIISSIQIWQFLYEKRKRDEVEEAKAEAEKTVDNNAQ